MGFIRKLFWFVLFLFFTFCWVVLFEHGPDNWKKGAEIEFEKLRNIVQPIEPAEDTSDRIVD